MGVSIVSILTNEVKIKVNFFSFFFPLMKLMFSTPKFTQIASYHNFSGKGPGDLHWKYKWDFGDDSTSGDDSKEKLEVNTRVQFPKS